MDITKLQPVGAKLPITGSSQTSLLETLALRRSTPIKLMDRDTPGPDDTELEQMLSLALRVPDHRKLEPWHIIVTAGNRRTDLGEIISERFLALHVEADTDEVALERDRPLRAPLLLTLVSSPDHEHKTPVWEQELSSGALCMNILNAAYAFGYGASWVTEWWAYDSHINSALGLTESERVAGHIFVGQTKAESLSERARPDVQSKASYF